MTDYIQKTLLNCTDADLTDCMKEHKVSTTMLNQKLCRIRDWYNIQPHLPHGGLEERYLIRHLAMNKYDEEKTKRKIEMLFTSKTVMPEIFSNRDPWSQRISKQLDSLDIAIMPNRTNDNNRIIFIRSNIDKKELNDLDLVAVCGFMISDIRTHFDCADGEIHVWDIGNVSFSQIKQINLTSLKKFLFVFQSCYGAYIKSIHVLNLPSIAEVVFNFLKGCLKKKIADRIEIHSTMESFRKVFPMKYLSKELGGEVPYSVKEIADQWNKAFKTPETRQWFLNLDAIKSDESKRLGKSDFLWDDLTGIRGTFRKLDLD